MQELITKGLSDPIFFIFIGFNIATFAFLFQYLSFPKSLLQDLSNMMKEVSHTCIPRPEKAQRPIDSDKVNRILCFYFDVDALTFTILLYLLYSILIALIIATVYFGILSDETKWVAGYAIIATSLIYIIVIIILIVITYRIGSKGAKETGRDNIWESRSHCLLFIGMHTAFLFISTYIISSISGKGILFLLNLIFFLVILLLAYLFILAIRMPVSTILSQWLDNYDRK